MSTIDLGAWFSERPKWLNEAARRLLKNGKFEGSDVTALADLCCKEVSETAGKCDCAFLDDAFVTSVSDPIRLCSIGNVQGINALAPKKPLTFGDGNLAVIYGQNGSGKSSYVRILKHACGARSPGNLHPNIFSSEPAPQKCLISYQNDGIQTQLEWNATAGMIQELRCIDVFDTSCGQVYVAKENEVTYEPLVLSFFSELIAVCEAVSTAIDERIAACISRKPTIPVDYASGTLGRWYVDLSKSTHDNEVQAYCAWCERDDKELADLDEQLSEQAPADKAKQLGIQRQYTDLLIASIADCLSKLSDENCKIVLDKKKDYNIKCTAAGSAAKQVFDNAPLQGIDSEVWQLLWEQARKYSQEQAYQGEEFPFIGDEARCVLCQQLLSEEAKTRTKSFEEFVKGELQKSADKAKEEVDASLEMIGELPTAEIVRTKLDAAGLALEEYASLIEESFTALRARKAQLLSANSVDDLDGLPQCQEWIDKAKSKSLGYSESAKRYEELAQQNNRDELIAKRTELQTRKWLSQQRTTVEAEIKRLRQIDSLNAAKRLTNTAGLSRKKGELAEELITEAFVERFESELRELGADRISIELVKTRVDHGRVLHRLRLRNTSAGSPEDVLSEGEHRIVSLAAFLADVAEKHNSAPFVFDDPISSLDQDFEEAVVQRLVKLAKDRQVIVFTHRLSLLGLIQDYGTKGGCEPYVLCVRQETWGAGEPGDTPLFAKKPEKALNALINDRLAKARKLLEEHGHECYAPFAKSICSDYRILLERMIECDLLADVVQRYRRAVNTMGKIGKLAHITDADCAFFDSMMTKYSRYEHSQPGEAPVALPDPDELQRDMESLKQWREEFVARGAK